MGQGVCGALKAVVVVSTFSLEYCYYLRADETASDISSARLDAFGIQREYFAGSSGMELIDVMTAGASADRNDWREQSLEKEREGLNWLRQKMAES